MFTGIIEDVGTIDRVSSGAGGGREIWIRTAFDPSTIAIGDSIAVSGVCLTVTKKDGDRFSIDAGPETLSRTTIGQLTGGARVNLERALTLAQRLGGHLVQGHVDAVGTVRSVRQRENAYDLTIEAPPDVMRLVASRGSICIDGISLTVTTVEGAQFGVSIIPHTWRVTTLRDRLEGAGVNLEADLIARYVARLLEGRAESGGITEAFLEKHGFR
jgi:riboflavin synthase